MAEGWTRHLHADRFEVGSAGVEARGLDRRAVAVMAEAGVDISRQRSTRLEELGDREFAYVVTVCDHAHAQCPAFPARTRVIHVGFDDPPHLARGAIDETQALVHYRRVRDEIRRFVAALPETLAQDRGAAC